MSSLTVLLVEDNEADATIIREMIRDTDVEAATTWLKDGEAVIRFLDEGHHADVIILDLNMPKMDGHALLRKIVDKDPQHARHVVVLTGSSSPHDQERVRRMGIDRYLIKPMGVDEMEHVTAELRSMLLGIGTCLVNPERS